MTIFELLEILEAEIVSLRTRNLQLQTSLSERQSQMAPFPEGKQQQNGATGKKSRGKKILPKSGKRKAKMNDRVKAEQLELQPPESTAAAQQPARTIGKRQALGKSLLQLRKMSAARSQ